LTSPYERPDLLPLLELDRLLAALEEELARSGGSGGRAGAGEKGRGALPELVQARQRIALLEGENQLLRQRISAAREQLQRLRTRLRFVEDRGAGGGREGDAA
jgi:hypothetical protein